MINKVTLVDKSSILRKCKQFNLLTGTDSYRKTEILYYIESLGTETYLIKRKRPYPMKYESKALTFIKKINPEITEVKDLKDEGDCILFNLCILLHQLHNNICVIDYLDHFIHPSYYELACHYIIENAIEFNIQLFFSSHNIIFIREFAKTLLTVTESKKELNCYRINKKENIELIENEKLYEVIKQKQGII